MACKLAVDSKQWRFGPMQSADIEPALRIEVESFYNPWRRKDFIRVSSWGQVWTLHYRKGLVGYVAYVWDEQHSTLLIMNLAVASDCRRRGLASWLLGQVLLQVANTKMPKRWWIEADVLDGDFAGQMFYRRWGFRVVKTSQVAFGADVYRFRAEVLDGQLVGMSPIIKR